MVTWVLQVVFEALQTAVLRAQRSPFNQKRLDVPASMSEFRRLPFTTKEDLRTWGNYGLLVPGMNPVRLHGSSGSGGRTPTLSFYNRSDLHDVRELVQRVLIGSSVTPGDTVYIAFPFGMFTGGLAFLDAAEDMGCFCIPAGAKSAEEHAALITETRPTVFVGLPSTAVEIWSQYLPPSHNIHVGIFGGESWSKALARQLFSLKTITNVCGLSELGGPGLAFGPYDMEIQKDHYFVEIIDPYSGVVLPDGQWGEMVVTTLRRQCMPIIRYRTGDVSKILPESGRLGRIRGRFSERMFNENKEPVFPGDLEEILVPVGATRYEIRVGGKIPEVHVSALYISPEKTKQRIFDLTGLEVKVCVSPVAPSLGKAVRFVRT